ncbi:hypothetical protein HHX47_DHR7000220 [Lentinula edodes]|nr:hypothetical protein HHX47_DHR7000220 [Lentinula edodes]
MSTTASSITSDVAPAGFVSILDDQLFEHGERLKDKVVIITGAANGIGKEAAIRFASFGAKIVIGDLDVVGAEQTVSDIVASGGQATARKCNVTMWDDQVELFELAIQKYGSVDVVIPNAGIGEPESFLEVKLDKTGRPQKINLPTVHVNLTGVLYSVHLAQHYLVVNRKPNTQPLKAIVLIGSMDTGILPTPLKVFLAGCPLTPVPRIAGAIIYAASHPDPATSGCAYVLPDDGPVFKVPREEFKAGVYQLLEGKLQSITGIIYAIKYATDIVKIVAKPLFASVIAVGLARVLWFNRETLWTSLHI